MENISCLHGLIIYISYQRTVWPIEALINIDQIIIEQKFYHVKLTVKKRTFHNYQFNVSIGFQEHEFNEKGS